MIETYSIRILHSNGSWGKAIFTYKGFEIVFPCYKEKLSNSEFIEVFWPDSLVVVWIKHIGVAFYSAGKISLYDTIKNLFKLIIIIPNKYLYLSCINKRINFQNLKEESKDVIDQSLRSFIGGITLLALNILGVLSPLFFYLYNPRDALRLWGKIDRMRNKDPWMGSIYTPDCAPNPQASATVRH